MPIDENSRYTSFQAENLGDLLIVSEGRQLLPNPILPEAPAIKPTFHRYHHINNDPASQLHDSLGRDASQLKLKLIPLVLQILEFLECEATYVEAQNLQIPQQWWPSRSTTN